MPEIGIAPWAPDLRTLGIVARDFVDAGGTSIWVSESERSAIVQAATLASLVDGAVLGTCISLAFARSGLLTALSAMDLDDLTNGSFVLGMGTGVKSVNERWHDVDFSEPSDRFADRIGLVRTLIEGIQQNERVEWHSRWNDVDVRLARRTVAPRTRVPIFAAAVGPRMLQVAGELADGWLGHELSSPKLVTDTVLPGLKRGADSAGRELASITTVAGSCCSVHPDRGVALRRAASTVAYYATVRPFTPMFEFHGYGDAARRIQRRFRAGDRGLELVDEVSEGMVATYSVAGTPDEVSAQLKEWDGVSDILRLHPPRPRLGLSEEDTLDAQQRMMEVLS